MKTIRIRNWDTSFENNRTRGLKKIDWVPIPNRMDKREYVRLVTHKNGASHLGAWLAIVEIASRCEPRGTLPWEGAEIPQALAEISRLPARVFEEVIPRLVELKWIELVTDDPHGDAEIPHEGAEIPHDDAPRTRAMKGREGNGREEKGREENAAGAALVLVSPISESDLISATATRIRERHPPQRTCSQKEADQQLSAIVAKVPKHERATRLQGIDFRHQGWCESDDWTKEGGKYAKGLANWLAPTKGRYDLDPPPRASPNAPSGKISITNQVAQLAMQRIARDGHL